MNLLHRLMGKCETLLRQDWNSLEALNSALKNIRGGLNSLDLPQEVMTEFRRDNPFLMYKTEAPIVFQEEESTKQSVISSHCRGVEMLLEKLCDASSSLEESTRLPTPNALVSTEENVLQATP